MSYRNAADPRKRDASAFEDAIAEVQAKVKEDETVLVASQAMEEWLVFLSLLCTEICGIRFEAKVDCGRSIIIKGGFWKFLQFWVLCVAYYRACLLFETQCKGSKLPNCTRVYVIDFNSNVKAICS